MAWECQGAVAAHQYVLEAWPRINMSICTCFQVRREATHSHIEIKQEKHGKATKSIFQELLATTTCAPVWTPYVPQSHDIARLPVATCSVMFTSSTHLGNLSSWSEVRAIQRLLTALCTFVNNLSLIQYEDLVAIASHINSFQVQVIPDPRAIWRDEVTSCSHHPTV